MERQTAELNELRKQSAGFLEQKQKIASLSGQLKVQTRQCMLHGS